MNERMKPKTIDLVIYDVNGNEHVIKITVKEAVGIIQSLAEAIT